MGREERLLAWYFGQKLFIVNMAGSCPERAHVKTNVCIRKTHELFTELLSTALAVARGFNKN